MDSARLPVGTEAGPPDVTASPAPLRSWSDKYGEKHRLLRVEQFPPGIIAPRRVRVYRRTDHYVLQWWDQAARRNLSDRVEGDLVAALVRARQIEERLDHFRGAAPGRRRVGHLELVEAFLADLGRRADAGQVDLATVRRYTSALNHYVAFAEQPLMARAFPYAAGVNREFALAFAAFLAHRRVSPNGRPGAIPQPLKGTQFVVDATRALFAWAADPERGGLLPDGFRNPFAGRARDTGQPAPDLLGEPEITADMAAAFLEACDDDQLTLFAPLILFGLRAAEPCFLFREDVAAGWLRVSCRPELAYVTKGRRDKRFPLPAGLGELFDRVLAPARAGLLYVRPGVAEGRTPAPLRGTSCDDLIAEFRKRLGKLRTPDAETTRQVRDDVLQDAGALTYDYIQAQFRRLARRLGWPRGATLKDFRHLFATSLENAGVPESYRRYLMGHAPGHAALVSYTHLNQLAARYEVMLRGEMAPVIAVLDRRLGRSLA